MTFWNFTFFRKTFLDQSLWIFKWVSWWCHRLTICHIYYTWNFENFHIFPDTGKSISLYQNISESTSVKTIRPLSLPVPIPAQRARKPSQMQQKTNSSHLPPPAGPTGVHPDAVPLILFSLAYASRVQTSFLCCCNPTVLPNFAAIRWDLSFFLDI